MIDSAKIISVEESLRRLVDGGGGGHGDGGGAGAFDVRAPVEFQEASIPGTVNIPILTNEERHRVGLTYKEQGPDAAIRLGHSLVCGEVKASRVRAWCEFVKDSVAKSKSPFLFCFRGGLRSETAQNWLLEVGVEIPRTRGGYKALRRALTEKTDELVNATPFVVLSGMTGVGKTDFLRRRASEIRVVDLEHLACHRGSSFGGTGLGPQPSQASFENALALALMKGAKECEGDPSLMSPVWIEDESRTIGAVNLPPSLFTKMRDSPHILLEAHREERALRIFREYILESPLLPPVLEEEMKGAVLRLSRKLGGGLTTEILAEMKKAFQVQQQGLSEAHLNWISLLLQHYYDPLYQRHLERVNPQILFRGNYSPKFRKVLRF